MRAELLQKGLEIRLKHQGRTERLTADSYPGIPGAASMFAQFSAMHLLAPHLPRQVTADFPIGEPMRQLIAAMYASEKKRPPHIDAPGSLKLSTMPVSPKRAIISYSAGKDSLWNMWWAQQEYGKENVLAVHINGLNRANMTDERVYAQRQAERFGFNLRMLNLHNSSGGKGYQVMRSRDMFMVGILAPYAIEFGAQDILIEGFGEVSPTEPFTGQEHNMKSFNRTLKRMGIPVRAHWKNVQEMDAVKDMFEHKPQWMEEVCNCFSAKCYKVRLHAYWKDKTPSFKMYESQCGSCIKCRIVNVGRMLYDSGFDATAEDVRTYLKNTKAWIKERSDTHRDMITDRFLEDVGAACLKYRL
jgi:hypothetical protein